MLLLYFILLCGLYLLIRYVVESILDKIEDSQIRKYEIKNIIRPFVERINNVYIPENEQKELFAYLKKIFPNLEHRILNDQIEKELDQESLNWYYVNKKKSKKSRKRYYRRY